MESSRVVAELGLGDGSKLSVVETFCDAVGDVVPALRFEFLHNGKTQTLLAYLVNPTTKEEVHEKLAEALLDINNSDACAVGVAQDQSGDDVTEEENG
jgi:hypothetical protein